MKSQAKHQASRLIRTLLLSSALAAGWSGSALAQGLVDEIVITAQKREQALQDVGLAVAAFTGETVTQLGVKDATDLTKLVAGLSINTQGGEGNQPVIFLRGVGLNDFSENNSSPVAVYFDEVYISSQAAQTIGLYDLERIEVLKGPQGTLYGRNASGGAIRLIPAQPGAEFAAKGRVSYGEFGTLRAEAAVNAPIGENAALRLSAMRSESDGYMSNALTGGDAGGYSVTGLRAILDIDAPAGLSIQATAFADLTDSPGAAYRFVGAGDPLTGAPCAAAAVKAGACVDFFGYGGEAGTYDGAYDNPGGTDRDTYGAILKLNKAFGGMDVTSVTSFITVDSSVNNDTDASPNSVLHLGFDVKSDTFTQELRAAWSGDRYDLVAGVYFLKDDLKQDQTADVFGGFRGLAQLIDPVAFPGGFDPFGAAVGAPIFFARNLNDQSTTAYALFGQFEYDLSERLRLITGLRASKEDRDFDTLVRFEEPGFQIPVYDLTLKVEDENISGRLGLEYKPNDDVLLYGNVSTGFKSGGFNGGFLLDPAQAQPYDPETLTAYEVGAKTEWLDGRLRLNAAAFFYDYKDIQLFTLVSTGGVPTSVLTNAGGAEIRGLELELTARPFEGFDISLNTALLDTELTEFQTAAALGGQDYTGNRLPKTPKVSFSGQATYERDLNDWGRLRLLGAAKYQSKVFFDNTNSEVLSQDGYWVVDARAAVSAPDDRWEVALFARNLMDEDYNVVGINLADFGFYAEVPGAPRILGVELAFRY